MNTSDFESNVRALLEARAGGDVLQSLPGGEPADFDEAYAIQEAVARALGAVGGWKVGGKPEAEPTCAPMQAVDIHRTNYRMPHQAGRKCGVECELAVRMKSDLPPRERPYTREEVLDAIATVHPAFEVVTYRLADHESLSRVVLATDAFGNRAFVYGAGCEERVGLDQTQQRVLFDVNGERKVDMTGGNPAGDIFRLITWLANHLARRGSGLRAGQFVTTGSSTGMLFLEGGESLRAEFPGVGIVEMSIAAEA